MFILFFVVVRKRYCLPTSYQNVGVIALIPTCLQSKRVTQTCMFTLFFVVVRKTVLFLPSSYQNVGVIISNPYLFTKFHASKHLGKRVTQTCMCYCNVWAEVVYCGFPKSKVFTKTLICLFPVCHQSLYFYQVSYVGCTPVSEIREFNQKKMNKRI